MSIDVDACFAILFTFFLIVIACTILLQPPVPGNIDQMYVESHFSLTTEIWFEGLHLANICQTLKICQGSGIYGVLAELPPIYKRSPLALLAELPPIYFALYA